MTQPDFPRRRQWMVQHQVAERGVQESLVLDALLAVSREEFLPPELQEFAYEDTSLPLPQGRVLEQPYVLALGLAALGLRGGEKVLEIGTGCGYASAVLAQIAGEVYTVEPEARLAERAAEHFSRHGPRNLHVMHGEPELGWSEQAPFDAILVHGGMPLHAQRLREQLVVGGRLVMPLPDSGRVQELVRVRRISELQYQSEDIADLRVAPLLGGSLLPAARAASGGASAEQLDARVAAALALAGESFDRLDDADLEPLLRRIGQARVVLIGEATHGTSEFYRMRQRITRALIEKRGFDFVAVEGDWPDCARVDHYVRHADPPSRWKAFGRFPTWMWRNREVAQFVDWLREFNSGLRPAQRTAFYGLDLYSMYSSIERVLEYLDRVDPETADVARQRYGCLSPWEGDPATYAHAALTASYRSCEQPVVAMLRDMLHGQSAYGAFDGERFLDALQNARLVANAERYYRTMYYGSRASWNLRDGHMFETLRTLLDFRGPQSRAVVWAHNSHVGDSAATEMALRGEFNIGRLCRKVFGEQSYSIGFGTHAGTVAAASRWGGEMQRMQVRASAARSCERVFHDSLVPGMLLPLRTIPASGDLAALRQPRLQRAIGVIYRPQSEMASHYFESVLPRQFDEYIWFDRTGAVEPLDSMTLEGMPDTYPFGL